MAGTIYGSKIQGMRAAVGDTLVELGKKNDRIVVIDAETAVATNIMPFKEAFPDRFLTTCIAEQNAISVAYGLQRMGYIPFVPLFRKTCFRSDICAGRLSECQYQDDGWLCRHYFCQRRCDPPILQ